MAEAADAPVARRRTPARGQGRPNGAVPHNLPAEVTAFLGRAKELDEVAQLFDGSRLVTLTGPPGIGKSRLSMEVARKLVPQYPDGVWLVELASVTDGASVPLAVASAISVEEVAGESLIETIVSRLGERRLLLMLDNCEHLIRRCAEMVNALLRGCPELRIVATSREAFGIAGETIWQVPPLSVPDLPHQRPDALMGYGAVELFVDRARAIQPSFSLTTEVAPAVAELCRGVDGIPLAIELAASRIEALTPADIARRLDDRFGLLSRGNHSALPRHQALQAALDWSHDLLSGHERVLLRRLSVFTGGFELEAVEAIYRGGEVQGEEVFDLLVSLVAKSLVVAETSNASHARYRLLETIRAYARERLDEAGETDEHQRRHVAWYLGLAERAEPELTGPDQQRWLDRLEAERENLRCALEWSLANAETEWALRLAGALVLFWRVHCHFSEGRDLLHRAISVSHAAAPELRAKALWGAGFLALMTGDLEGAGRALEKSLACFRELGDLKGCARALLVLGNTREFRDPSGAMSLLEESGALAREAGDAWCLAHALGCSAMAHEIANDVTAARALFEQGLAVARQAQDKQGLRFNLIGLASPALAQGDYRRAEPVLEEALVLTQELGEDYATAMGLRCLGELAAGRGDYERARELLEQSLSLIRAVGPPSEEPERLIVVGLAKAVHAGGDRSDAHQLFEQALALCPSEDHVSPDLLQGLGELCAEEGDLAEARRLWEKARDIAEARGSKASTATALHSLGQLARDAGDCRRAAALHHEGLQLRRQSGDAHGMADSIEAVGGLAAVARRHQHAARLFGAAGAIREANGYARPAWASVRYQADVALITEALSAEELERAYAQGAALSIEDTVIEASKGRGARAQTGSGWGSLTDTEKQVAALVAEGLTNPEIAERLFLGLGTVKDHVSRIFAKLGVSRRRELARETRRRDSHS